MRKNEGKVDIPFRDIRDLRIVLDMKTHVESKTKFQCQPNHVKLI